ncbi:50S ribosomal protein L13 [Halomarina salina]|uniref:Large ribosomal subunit protein uL13 n=1 Tax=Halomarina salina TaxID=1872699 RepID=A0ABD5RRX0_9EURY|nr:50S ribosomal protein L13 [Halomarina salina]
MSVAEFDADLVVDARDCILGRVASEVSQRAMDGERVAVVNAEHAIVTGDEDDVLAKYRKRVEVGSDRGPYYPKRPDRLFKRAIRGMVPYKTPRGREAFENVRTYVGNPYEGDENREAEILDGTSLDRLSNIKFVTLGEISEQIGANVTW